MDSIKKCDKWNGNGYILKNFQIAPGFYQRVQ